MKFRQIVTFELNQLLPFSVFYLEDGGSRDCSEMLVLGL
jgi:hypothetical protein